MFSSSVCSLMRFLGRQPAVYGFIADKETCLWSLGLEVLGKVLHSPELILGSWWCWTCVSGVCRMGSQSALQHLWTDQFSLAPVQRFSQLPCAWRGRHRLWWHPPHFLCCGQVLPAVSRCKVFNRVHLLPVCWWSVMLVLVVLYRAGLYHVAQPVCVGSVAAIACHVGAFLHIPTEAIFPLLSTLYSVGPALMLAEQPHQSNIRYLLPQHK